MDKLVRIQRRFLSGGGSDLNKIAWVNWEIVCLPKERGGLGIKDITSFNLALLGKWKWELFHRQDELWAKVLVSRYGDWRGLAEAPYDKNASLWWRDLKLALHQPSIQNVFRDGIAWKVGRGDKILFWEDNWLQGDAALVARYPKLYHNSSQQNHRIMDMGAQKDMGWEWNFKWRRHLFDSELDMAARFLCDVDDCHIQRNRMDEWIWKADPSGSYSTKSAYAEMWGEAAADNQVQDFEELWKLKIPPKVVVFAWRLFRDRLPTKSNLTRRNVALNDTSCPFCRRTEEDAAHLFLHCHKILPLWWESMAWVNILGVSPQYPRQHFSQHAAVMVKGIRQNRWKCWWMALTWAVWQQRNKILFSQQTFDGNKILEDAVLLLWTWLRTFEENFMISFNHWSSNLPAAFIQ